MAYPLALGLGMDKQATYLVIEDADEADHLILQLKDPGIDIGQVITGYGLSFLLEEAIVLEGMGNTRGGIPHLQQG